MTDSIPEKLGKYKIIEEVGRGGFAAVYKAVDTTLDRVVALKVLAPHLLWDPTFVQRFQREAKVAANLDHPNIVTIYEVSQTEGVYFIAMQFLEGRTVSQILEAEGPWPVSQVQAIIEQIASALDYAHARGFVHRDIKPSNVIVADDGRATLTDFGLVKAGEGTKLSTTGVVFGTPEYMSPEQAEGKVLDARSDVYSLGVVIYEMLAGRAPFVADITPAVMYKHVHEPPPLDELPSDLPQSVVAVVEKALAKKREARYQSAGEMARALEEATEARVEVTLPPEPEIPAPPPVVKKPVVEEVVSPPVERAAVAEERVRPPIARPAPKAVPKKTPGVGALLAGGLVSVCVVGIIVVALIRLWPTPAPVPPTEAPIEAPTEAPPPEAPTEAPPPEAPTEAPPPPVEGPIKIGNVAPLTGDIPWVGEGAKYALEMWLEDVKLAGGLVVGNKVHDVEVIHKDNESEGESAAAAATKLIVEDGVLAIIGAYASKQAIPTGEVADANETPMVSPWSTNPRTTKDRPWVFRACFLDPVQGSVIAKFATEEFGATRAAVLYDVASDYPKGLAEVFKSVFEEIHGEGSVVAFETFTTGDRDFSAQLTRIVASDADFLFTPQYYDEVPLIVQQTYELGWWDKPILGSDAWGSAELMNRCGDDCVGLYFSTHYAAAGAKGATKEFIDRYTEKYGYVPDDVAALTWDTALIVQKAIQDCGNITGDIKQDRKCVRDALAKIKDFDGITGKMTFTEEGDPIKCAVIVKINEAHEFEFYKSACP